MLPFLRDSKHPLFPSGKIDFSSVDENFTDEFVSKSAAGYEAMTSKKVGVTCRQGGAEVVGEMEHEESAGEIVSGHSTSDIFCALVRLDKFLPKNPSDEISACHVIDDELPAGSAGEVLRKNTPAVSFVPIRPPFWLELDPITGHRIDTHVS